MLDRDSWTLQGLAEEVRSGTSLAALLEGRPVLIVHRGDPNDEIVFNTPSQADLESARDLAKTNPGGDETQITNAANPMVELAQPHHRVISLIKSDRNPFSGMITVGRARNNDVRINSAQVSKIHCFFHQGKDGKWWLEDNSSTNGTLLNDQLVQGKTDRELQSGDEITFGGIATLFLDTAGLRSILELVPSA